MSVATIQRICIEFSYVRENKIINRQLFGCILQVMLVNQFDQNGNNTIYKQINSGINFRRFLVTSKLEQVVKIQLRGDL